MYLLKTVGDYYHIIYIKPHTERNSGKIHGKAIGEMVFLFVSMHAPIFKVFGYNPSDARFIGDPVDYVIFDGYTQIRERREDRPIRVVLADVKTGGAGLTYEQRRIRLGAERGLVEFREIRM